MNGAEAKSAETEASFLFCAFTTRMILPLLRTLFHTCFFLAIIVIRKDRYMVKKIEQNHLLKKARK